MDKSKIDLAGVDAGAKMLVTADTRFQGCKGGSNPVIQKRVDGSVTGVAGR